MTAALHVATTQESLWAESSHPTEGRRMVECKLEVCWLRACTVEIAMTHGGNEVTSFNRFNDFHGFGTSLDAGMERALELCGHFGVGTSSSAVMEVRLKVCDQPAIRSTSGRALEAVARARAEPGRHKQWWGEFPFDKFRTRTLDPASLPGLPADAAWRYPQLEQKLVVDRLAWSSKSFDGWSAKVWGEKLRDAVRAEFAPVRDLQPLVSA